MSNVPADVTDREMLELCALQFAFLGKAAACKRLTRVAKPGETRPKSESAYVVIQQECQAAISRIREHLEATNVREG